MPSQKEFNSSKDDDRKNQTIKTQNVDNNAPQLQEPEVITNENKTAQGACTNYGWLNGLSWAAVVVGVGLLTTGSVFLAIVNSKVGSGYSAANCTATISGGHLNRDYCDCDKCKCRKTCCDYDVMVIPLADSSPFNRSMRKRSCSTGSPCEDWYGQLGAHLGSQTLSGSKKFPCLYNKDKFISDDSASAFCIVGFCDVITLPEHAKLADYGKYVEGLLPLWIVLVVLGVMALCVLPLRVARVTSVTASSRSRRAAVAPEQVPP